MCRSVQYLHSQDPPIIHRDLKLENFLVGSSYSIKLCDFGSATTQIFHPDNSWSANKRNLIEDEIARQTTPMYRAPEMLDLYSNYRIDTQADIWALGCVLYEMCSLDPPYSSSNILTLVTKITQAEYDHTKLAANSYSTQIETVVQNCMIVDNVKRPDIIGVASLIADKILNYTEGVRFKCANLEKKLNR